MNFKPQRNHRKLLTTLLRSLWLTAGEILRLCRIPSIQYRGGQRALSWAAYRFPMQLASSKRNARRTIPLTDKAAQMLRSRKETASGELVFANRDGMRYLVTSINHLHQKARAIVGLGRDFVIHSLRHVHPSPEAVERAFERLQLSGNQGQIEPKVLLPPTNFPTVGTAVSVTH